jgi:hypothetical protein
MYELYIFIFRQMSINIRQVKHPRGTAACLPLSSSGIKENLYARISETICHFLRRDCGGGGRHRPGPRGGRGYATRFLGVRHGQLGARNVNCPTAGYSSV